MKLDYSEQLENALSLIESLRNNENGNSIYESTNYSDLLNENDILFH